MRYRDFKEKMPNMIYNMLCVLEIMPLPVRIIASVGLFCLVALIVIVAIGFTTDGVTFSKGVAPHYAWVMLILSTVSMVLLGKYRQQFP
jgi:hypothetical protein